MLAACNSAISQLNSLLTFSINDCRNLAGARILRDGLERERTNLIHGGGDYFLERLRAWWVRQSSRIKRVVEQPAIHPSDRRAADQPGGGAEALGVGMPAASRFRAVARLRCEPLRFASSAGVRPRAPSSPSARTASCRSAVADTRARARDRRHMRFAVATVAAAAVVAAALAAAPEEAAVHT